MIINVDQGETYAESELGATAVDYQGNDITGEIVRTGNVDTTTQFDENDPSTYTEEISVFPNFYLRRYYTVYYSVRGLTKKREVTVSMNKLYM